VDELGQRLAKKEKITNQSGKYRIMNVALSGKVQEYEKKTQNDNKRDGCKESCL
jgi:hypothetical protein